MSWASSAQSKPHMPAADSRDRASLNPRRFVGHGSPVAGIVALIQFRELFAETLAKSLDGNSGQISPPRAPGIRNATLASFAAAPECNPPPRRRAMMRSALQDSQVAAHAAIGLHSETPERGHAGLMRWAIVAESQFAAINGRKGGALQLHRRAEAAIRAIDSKIADLSADFHFIAEPNSA